MRMAGTGGKIQKFGHMRSLVSYIEDNLPDDLDTGLLKGVGFVSCAQLYRDFYSLTGHSVKEYVRKRRLSNALALIKASDLSLTDVALQCGYSSHQAMCRAVRQMLGLTPSGYRDGETYYFFPPFNGEPLQSVTVAAETIPSARRVLFYGSSAMGIEDMAVGTLLRALPDYGGRIFGRNGEQVGNRLCYELYLTDIGHGCGILRQYGFRVAQETPRFEATFATATVKNNEREINAAWDYLYSKWLQNSMFEYTGEPYCEEYRIRNGRPSKLKLYLPIRRRCEDTKINLTDNPGLRFVVSEARGDNAEKVASQTVIGYLAERYPYIVKASREYYLRKDQDSYACGVRIEPGQRIACNGKVACAATSHGKYLVLESSVAGDYYRYAGMLLGFARDNGMKADTQGIFAVYDAKESFDNPKARMYCPVKIEKN